MSAKCSSSHVDPHRMDLFFPSFCIFSFFFPVLPLNFFSSVPTYHMLCSSWSHHQTETQTPMISTYYLLCQHRWPAGSLGVVRPSLHSPNECPDHLGHLSNKGEIAFSVVEAACWNGRNWHHDGASLPFSVLQNYCLSCYEALALPRAWLLQKRGTESASALWNTCQTSHGDPWDRAPGHLLQRCRHLSLRLRRRLLAAAILSCGCLRMTDRMDCLERCSHTQPRRERATMEHSWVSPRKRRRNPASHAVTELGGNKGKEPSDTLFLRPVNL